MHFVSHYKMTNWTRTNDINGTFGGKKALQILIIEIIMVGSVYLFNSLPAFAIDGIPECAFLRI